MVPKRAVSTISAMSFVASLLLAPGPASGSTDCPPLDQPPWIGVEVKGEALDAADALLETLSATPQVSFAMSWYTWDGTDQLLNIGAAGSIQAAEAVVADMKGVDDAMPPTKLVSVPYSWAELEGYQIQVDELLSEKQIPFTSEKRPDTGVIEVQLQPEAAESFSASLEALAPPCTVRIETTDTAAGGFFDISRNDQPPYKAGKALRVLNPAGTFGCESGFVFQNGSGPLLGSMSGHCSKGAGRTVTDNLSPFTTVGSTVSPNPFWASQPANADGVMYDLAFANSDVQSRVIVNESLQEDVVGKVGESAISAGSQGCRALISIDEHCGAVDDLDVTFGANTTDPVTGATVFKSVRHEYCFDENTASGGDSGAPVYRYTTGGVKALGLHSGHNSSLGDCFSPQSRIASETGTHVVLA
jgi:hypothetical protein